MQKFSGSILPGGRLIRGETVTDGPYVEAKQFVASFTLIQADDFDTAVSIAAVAPADIPARYPGWHAVVDELHFRLGRRSAAERAWREALLWTTAGADREFLRRLADCRRVLGLPAGPDSRDARPPGGG